jgi:dTDP-4-amino-4,6-dideoxygalactose transaminase
MFYVIPNEKIERAQVIANLKHQGIHSVFHYVPLHSSHFGLKTGKTYTSCLPVTDFVSNQLIRLPFWVGLSAESQGQVIKTLLNSVGLLEIEADLTPIRHHKPSIRTNSTQFIPV